MSQSHRASVMQAAHSRAISRSVKRTPLSPAASMEAPSTCSLHRVGAFPCWPSSGVQSWTVARINPRRRSTPMARAASSQNRSSATLPCRGGFGAQCCPGGFFPMADHAPLSFGVEVSDSLRPALDVHDEASRSRREERPWNPPGSQPGSQTGSLPPRTHLCPDERRRTPYPLPPGASRRSRSSAEARRSRPALLDAEEVRGSNPLAPTQDVWRSWRRASPSHRAQLAATPAERCSRAGWNADVTSCTRTGRRRSPRRPGGDWSRQRPERTSSTARPGTPMSSVVRSPAGGTTSASRTGRRGRRGEQGRRGRIRSDSRSGGNSTP